MPRVCFSTPKGEKTFTNIVATMDPAAPRRYCPP
jgi:hypothetical protein